jgi:hypothetical protein
METLSSESRAKERWSKLLDPTSAHSSSTISVLA